MNKLYYFSTQRCHLKYKFILHGIFSRPFLYEYFSLLPSPFTYFKEQSSED